MVITQLVKVVVMAHQNFTKEDGLLRFSLNGYMVTFSRPSLNTASALVEIGSSSFTIGCTISQISFHWDELSGLYFIQFGTGTTVSNFNWFHCRLIADFLGLLLISMCWRLNNDSSKLFIIRIAPLRS